MTRVSKRKLWLTVIGCAGMRIPVYCARGLLHLDGAQVDAFFDVDTPEIVIAWVPNTAVMKLRLHHELLHVCFGTYSGDTKAQVLGGRTTNARWAREEHVVSFLEPVQYDLLVRNGWLRYPDPPRFR
jgi:hypothetical protein